MMKRTSSLNSQKESAGMASSPNSGACDSSANPPPPPLNSAIISNAVPDEEFTFDIDTMELETGDEESCCGTAGSMSVSALGTLGGGASRSISLNQGPVMRSSKTANGGDGGGVWTVHGGPPIASSPRGMGSSDLAQPPSPAHATSMTSSPILFASSGRGSVMRNQPSNGVPPPPVVTQSTKIGAKSASTSNSTHKGSNSSSSAQSKRGRDKPRGSPNPAPPPQQQQQQEINGSQHQHSPWPTPPARVDDWGASGNSAYGNSALSSVNAVGNRSVSGTDFRIVSVTSANNNNNMYYNSGHDMQQHHQTMPQNYGGNNSGSRTSITSFHGVVVADNNNNRTTATGSANSSTLNDIPHALIHHSDTGSHVSERSSVTPYDNNSPPQSTSVATPTRNVNTGKMMIGRPRGSQQQQQPSQHQNYNSNGGAMGQQRSPEHSQGSNSRQGSMDYGPPHVFNNNGMHHHHHHIGVGGQPQQQGMGLQIGQYPNQQHYAPPPHQQHQQVQQQPPSGGIKIQVGSYAPIKFAPSITVGGKTAGAPPQPR